MKVNSKILGAVTGGASAGIPAELEQGIFNILVGMATWLITEGISWLQKRLKR